MREFDAKFLAGILILKIYTFKIVNIFVKFTNIRIPARNFVSNARIPTIMQYSAEVQQWRKVQQITHNGSIQLTILRS